MFAAFDVSTEPVRNVSKDCLDARQRVTYQNNYRIKVSNGQDSFKGVLRTLAWIGQIVGRDAHNKPVLGQTKQLTCFVAAT